MIGGERCPLRGLGAGRKTFAEELELDSVQTRRWLGPTEWMPGGRQEGW